MKDGEYYDWGRCRWVEREVMMHPTRVLQQSCTAIVVRNGAIVHQSNPTWVDVPTESE